MSFVDVRIWGGPRDGETISVPADLPGHVVLEDERPPRTLRKATFVHFDQLVYLDESSVKIEKLAEWGPRRSV